ncbi:MAG: asparagine--tRNA ligase [Lachnospirales bacterium]
MMYTKVREIYKDEAKFMNNKVQVGGWIRTLRDNKNFAFIELNDGTFFKSVQVVVHNDLSNYEEVIKLGVGASVTVVGEVVESVGAKQKFEIKALDVVVEGDSPSDYPLQKKRHSVEYLRTISHLRPKTNLFSAMFRVRSESSFAIHKFFNEQGFVYTHTPIITASDAEGAGEMFRVTTLDPKNPKLNEDSEVDFKEDFFGKMSMLTVSGQLNAETFAMAFRDIYTFGPTFRAENSNTTRHAAEFWMMEPEIAFADLKDVMNLAERMIKYMVKHLLENCPEEMEFFNSFVDKTLLKRLTSLVESDFGVVTYTEAIELLEKADKKFQYPVSWGVDLQTEHERYITEEIYNKPVFVTDYPKEIKAFYMRNNEDGKTVAAMDLLVPGVGELIGGSQREERYEELLEKIKENGLDLKHYDWYLDLRKYGTVKHGGFGLGFERFLMYATGVSNIRDVIPYARTTNNLEF